jgi:hypothetical protein
MKLEELIAKRDRLRAMRKFEEAAKVTAEINNFQKLERIETGFNSEEITTLGDSIVKTKSLNLKSVFCLLPIIGVSKSDGETIVLFGWLHKVYCITF